MTGSCCRCVLGERGVAEHKLSGMVVTLFQHSDCDRGCMMSIDDVDGAHECEQKSNDVDVEDSTCRYPWDEKQSFVSHIARLFPQDHGWALQILATLFPTVSTAVMPLAVSRRTGSTFTLWRCAPFGRPDHHMTVSRTDFNFKVEIKLTIFPQNPQRRPR